MADPPIENAEGFGKKIEAASKALTLTLGGFYVLGLLITNAQLMALGIADFSALQARFVLVGALFAFYLLLWVPLLFVLLALCGLAYGWCRAYAGRANMRRWRP